MPSGVAGGLLRNLQGSSSIIVAVPLPILHQGTFSHVLVTALCTLGSNIVLFVAIHPLIAYTWTNIRLPHHLAGPGATDVEKQIKRKGEDGKKEDRGEVLRAIYKEELGLTVDCIKRNPKSYPAWHHHKWAMEKGLDFLGGRYALLPRVVCKHAGNHGRKDAGSVEEGGWQ